MPSAHDYYYATEKERRLMGRPDDFRPIDARDDNQEYRALESQLWGHAAPAPDIEPEKP